MLPAAEGGTDDINNAIPLCFECHAEVHAHNDKHPRGRKFRPSELKLHKEHWLNFCDQNAGALASAPADASVGPLQGLLDEIEFNQTVASRVSPAQLGCPFAIEQFRRALNAGALSMLSDVVRDVVNSVYVDVGLANHFLAASQQHPPGSNAYNTAMAEAQRAIASAADPLRNARYLLQQAIEGKT